jgi:excisionase family DNA binding protein
MLFYRRQKVFRVFDKRCRCGVYLQSHTHELRLETDDKSLRVTVFSIDEAAVYLRIGRTSLYRLIKNGQIETIKMLKRKQLIEQKVLDQLISNSNALNGKEISYGN